MYYIYRHIRLDKNVPFYIGLGSNNINDNYNRAKSSKNRNHIWNFIYNKINKNIRVDIIIDNLTLEEACEKEIEFIKLYGKIIDNTGTLSNILDGGSGSISNLLTDSQKKGLEKGRLAKSKCKWSEDRKNKFSIIRTGVSKKRGYSLSNETKIKMSESHKGNKSTKNKIYINNNIVYKLIDKDDIIPEGWHRGRKIINNN